MNQPIKTNLMSRFDADPGPWRPMYYSLVVSVPLAINGIGEGSIPIYNQPFIFERVTHEIIGPAANPSVAGIGVYQDGQYSISFGDEQTVYQDKPASANSMFGNVHNGTSIPLPFPLPYAGNKTIKFTVQNLITRTLVGATHFSVQITLHGKSNIDDIYHRR